MSAEIIPLRRDHTRAGGWRETLRTGELGTVTSFLERFATHLRARPASEATIYRYRLAAQQLADFFGDPDVSTITRTGVEQFIVARMAVTAGSTVAGTFVALCQFFKFVALDVAPDTFVPPTAGMTTPAFEERVIEVPPAEVLAGIIKHAQGQRDATGAKTFEGVRDEAILRMFVDTGARLAEITNMRVTDVLDDRIFVTGKSKGKGPVTRPLKISGRTRQALKAYLRVRRNHPSAADGALWLGQKGKLTPSGVRQMVWRRSQAGGGASTPTSSVTPSPTAGSPSPDSMTVISWRSWGGGRRGCCTVTVGRRPRTGPSTPMRGGWSLTMDSIDKRRSGMNSRPVSYFQRPDGVWIARCETCGHRRIGGKRLQFQVTGKERIDVVRWWDRHRTSERHAGALAWRAVRDGV